LFDKGGSRVTCSTPLPSKIEMYGLDSESFVATLAVVNFDAEQVLKVTA
jgi:hypothetical protein